MEFDKFYVFIFTKIKMNLHFQFDLLQNDKQHCFVTEIRDEVIFHFR